MILGKSGARAAYATGRGSIIMRCRHMIEEGRGDRRSIVLTSIPYQVGKNGLVEKIAEAAKDKRIEGVSDIRDESNREGVRDRHRPQARCDRPRSCSTRSGGTPRRSRASRPTCWRSAAAAPKRSASRTSSQAFIKFREEVITRRTKFELNKARDRAHILLGLVVAVTNLDEVVEIIRGAPNPAEARAQLLAREWPIGEIAQYIRLVEAIDDARNRGRSRRHLSPVRTAGPRDPRPAPAPPDRARPRRDRRRAGRPVAGDRRLPRNPRRPRQALRGDARRAGRGDATPSPRRACPRSPPPGTASTTRT